MRNIITICADGIRRLFSNAISTIIVISLVLLPSIFAWYNILACWDVFGNMGSLTIAVANEDEGYRSDLVPLKINVGEQVLSSLRENEEYNWVFTSSNDAIEGTKEGRYYAAVVIPKSFSRDMLTLDFAEISYDGKTYVSMIRGIRESELERLVFSRLVELGVPVEIESNS